MLARQPPCCANGRPLIKTFFGGWFRYRASPYPQLLYICIFPLSHVVNVNSCHRVLFLVTIILIFTIAFEYIKLLLCLWLRRFYDSSIDIQVWIVTNGIKMPKPKLIYMYYENFQIQEIYNGLNIHCWFCLEYACMLN